MSVSVNTGAGNNYSIEVTVGQGTHELSGNGDKGGGKVNILVDGQNVQSIDVDNCSNGTCSTTYSPKSAGSHTISAQVIDSVLYDATSSTQTISPFSLTATPNGGNNGNVKFTWSASGTVTVYNAATGGVVCTGANNCSTPKLLLTDGTKVYGRSNDDTSPEITVEY